MLMDEETQVLKMLHRTVPIHQFSSESVANIPETKTSESVLGKRESPEADAAVIRMKGW
jgi:hypothetical protein